LNSWFVPTNGAPAVQPVPFLFLDLNQACFYRRAFAPTAPLLLQAHPKQLAAQGWLSSSEDTSSKKPSLMSLSHSHMAFSSEHSSQLELTWEGVYCLCPLERRGDPGTAEVCFTSSSDRAIPGAHGRRCTGEQVNEGRKENQLPTQAGSSAFPYRSAISEASHLAGVQSLT
jgi:hypothetical protein